MAKQTARVKSSDSLSIISGRSNPTLAQRAAVAAGTTLRGCDVVVFSDGELSVEIQDNVRGHDVFVIQSTSTPVNDHLMELLLMFDALKRASAGRITAVIPYYGYSRQDRKSKPRVPISAKLVADLVVAAGADRVLTMDLHAGQIMGFFNVPVDNLYARPVLLKYIEDNYDVNQLCIVSPDAGGVARARAYAKRIDAGLAIIDKRRATANEVAEMNVVGEVSGKIAVIVDDMIDTGRTLVKASDALLEKGALKVIAIGTHAVFSGNAMARLAESSISEVIVSDTIYHPDLEAGKGKIKQLSVAELIGEAIKRTHNEESISSLFKSV